MSSWLASSARSKDWTEACAAVSFMYTSVLPHDPDRGMAVEAYPHMWSLAVEEQFYLYEQSDILSSKIHHEDVDHIKKHFNEVRRMMLKVDENKI